MDARAVEKLASLVRSGFDLLQANVVVLFKRQAAPANPQDGWLWYNDGSKQLQARLNGSTQTIASVIDRRGTNGPNVTNTTTETGLYSLSVPGGLLGTDRALRLTVFGRYLNNSGLNATFTLRVKYGGTTYYQGITPALATNASRRPCKFEVWLSANNATNSQRVWGQFAVGNVTATTTGEGAFSAGDQVAMTWAGNAAIDSTAAQTFALTLEHSTANANVTFGRHYAVIEVL